jgi:hypothetical protein
MSSLENSTEPILLPLMTGERTLDSLDEEERRTLAKWAGKTAIVESHAVGAESPVDPHFLRWMRLRADNVPGRFCVVACAQSRLGIGHLQVGIIRDLIGGGIAAGNVIVIMLPRVAFTCIFPMLPTEYEPRCVPSLYTPLWPGRKAWKVMDQTTMPTRFKDDMEFVLSLAERVELFHSVT